MRRKRPDWSGGGADGFYDRFRDRLLFPITNPRGRIIGFGGRLLGDGQPKYLNPRRRWFIRKAVPSMGWRRPGRDSPPGPSDCG